MKKKSNFGRNIRCDVTLGGENVGGITIFIGPGLVRLNV
jgi:hypothetical protein